jgi:hypothetical protein
MNYVQTQGKESYKEKMAPKIRQNLQPLNHNASLKSKLNQDRGGTSMAHLQSPIMLNKKSIE